MPNAADRNKRQSKASRKGNLTLVNDAPAENPAVTSQTRVRTPGSPSIKQTIIGLLKEGRSTAEISDILQATYPGTAAAEKPKTHISYYRSHLKRSGTGVAAQADQAASVRLAPTADGELDEETPAARPKRTRVTQHASKLAPKGKPRSKPAK